MKLDLFQHLPQGEPTTPTPFGKSYAGRCLLSDILSPPGWWRLCSTDRGARIQHLPISCVDEFESRSCRSRLRGRTATIRQCRRSDSTCGMRAAALPYRTLLDDNRRDTATEWWNSANFQSARKVLRCTYGMSVRHVTRGEEPHPAYHDHPGPLGDCDWSTVRWCRRGSSS
jgi:hypothetical protein